MALALTPVDGSGVVQPISGTVATTPSAVGTQANAWNNAAVVSGTTSAVIDTLTVNNLTIFGTVSTNMNPLRIQASQDNVNFYTITTVSLASGNWGTSLPFAARYCRLQAGQSATITATIAGK